MSENNITPIKRTVLDYNDIKELVPQLDGKEKLVNRLIHIFSLDKVNWLHDHNCDTPGAPFTEGLLRDLDIKVRVDNAEILDSMQGQPVITCSHHPFGALDGIILIYLLASRYPNFKVMVNLFLNYITAMRPNFIAVDPLASDDPVKKAATLRGI